MTRFALAAVLAVALGQQAGAQPVPTQPVPPPPPAVYQPNVYVPPDAPPGPAIPFHKSGGVVVGAYGLYPYDTGDWLLGGTLGTTRQSGSFTMVFPAAPPAVSVQTAPKGHFAGKHGLFRH